MTRFDDEKNFTIIDDEATGPMLFLYERDNIIANQPCGYFRNEFGAAPINDNHPAPDVWITLSEIETYIPPPPMEIEKMVLHFESVESQITHRNQPALGDMQELMEALQIMQDEQEHRNNLGASVNADTAVAPPPQPPVPNLFDDDAFSIIYSNEEIVPDSDDEGDDDDDLHAAENPIKSPARLLSFNRRSPPRAPKANKIVHQSPTPALARPIFPEVFVPDSEDESEDGSDSDSDDDDDHNDAENAPKSPARLRSFNGRSPPRAPKAIKIIQKSPPPALTRPKLRVIVFGNTLKSNN